MLFCFAESPENFSIACPRHRSRFMLRKSTVAKGRLPLQPSPLYERAGSGARQVFERPVRAIGRTVVDLMRSMAMRELTFFSGTAAINRL